MVGRQPCGGRGGRRLPPEPPTCWSSRLRRSTGGAPFESAVGRHRRTERKGSAFPLELSVGHGFRLWTTPSRRGVPPGDLGERQRRERECETLVHGHRGDASPTCSRGERVDASPGCWPL